jgi:hypothetical protein
MFEGLLLVGICLLFIPWVFVGLYFLRNGAKNYSPAAATAWSWSRLTSVGATVVGTFYGTYFAPVSGGLCMICGGPGGVISGMPLQWWGLQATGLTMVVTPLFLALDLLFWGLFGFLGLWALYAVALPRVSSEWREHGTWIAAVGLCLTPTLVPFLFPQFDIPAKIQTRVAAEAQERQQREQDRLRNDLPIAISAIEFRDCSDSLTESKMVREFRYLLLQVRVKVNHEATYELRADAPFASAFFREKLEIGEHTIPFSIVPTSVQVGSQREQTNRKDGPYQITFHVTTIDDIHGVPFTEFDFAKAHRLNLSDREGIEFTCETDAYAATDFGPLYGTFPRTATPARTRTP